MVHPHASKGSWAHPAKSRHRAQWSHRNHLSGPPVNPTAHLENSLSYSPQWLLWISLPLNDFIFSYSKTVIASYFTEKNRTISSVLTAHCQPHKPRFMGTRSLSGFLLIPPPTCPPLLPYTLHLFTLLYLQPLPLLHLPSTPRLDPALSFSFPSQIKLSTKLWFHFHFLTTHSLLTTHRLQSGFCIWLQCSSFNVTLMTSTSLNPRENFSSHLTCPLRRIPPPS